MKVEERTIMVPKKENVYIANDGTEFKYGGDCAAYELKNAVAALASIKDCKALENCPPPDGQEYSEYHEYRWYFVSSEDDAQKLAEAYRLEDLTPSIGKWVCVETADDGSAWVIVLDDAIAYAKYVCEELGYELILKKKEKAYADDIQ